MYNVHTWCTKDSTQHRTLLRRGKPYPDTPRAWPGRKHIDRIDRNQFRLNSRGINAHTFQQENTGLIPGSLYIKIFLTKSSGYGLLFHTKNVYKNSG